jgi:signal transduction histidine kinase
MAMSSPTQPNGTPLPQMADIPQMRDARIESDETVSELYEGVRDRLRPLAFSLVGVYLLLGFGHSILFVAGSRAFLGAVTGIIAAMIALTWWLFGRGRLPVRAVSPLLTLMSGLVLFNCIVHLVIYPNLQNTTMVAILVIGIGSLLLAPYWFALLSAITIIGWFGTSLMLPRSPDWGHFGFVLIEAAVIAILGLVARRRTILQLIGLRTRNRELEAAIADRRRAEEEATRLRDAAEAASQAKSAFLAMLNHELRTPITAVLGYTDLLLMRMPVNEPEQLAEDLQRIRRSTYQLYEMVNGLLDLSKIEAGKMQFSFDEVPIKQILDDTLLIIEPLAKIGKNKLCIEIELDRDTLMTDPTHIRQILVNLLANACKFTDNGTITLRIREADSAEEGMVLFEVSDTGIGMAPEQIEFLFQEYMQVHQSGRIGTGLGLSLSRRFARMMGGDITVQSVIGGGSCFTLALPLHR